MTLALWVLVGLVLWIGLSILSLLRDIAKEATTIRQFLQVGGDLKTVSVPANTLNIVQQLGEAVLKRIEQDQHSSERAKAPQGPERFGA